MSIIEIDREKFINAGMSYIYQLDKYPYKAVYEQVASEFDELLSLNNQAVLNQRAEFMGVGEPADYLQHLIETEQGQLIAGIRHIGGDKNAPFIYIWPGFKVDSISHLIRTISPYFDIFKPNALCYWCRPDCLEANGKVIQQRFIGDIESMAKRDVSLLKAHDYYDWYQSEYALFHQQKPEYKNRITLNSKALMDESLDQDLLFFFNQKNERVGLIAGEKRTFLNKESIYLNEILVAHAHRGKGLGHQLLTGFVNLLTADYFICDIDSDNKPSTHAALKSGQVVFSQEVFIHF